MFKTKYFFLLVFIVEVSCNGARLVQAVRFAPQLKRIALNRVPLSVMQKRTAVTTSSVTQHRAPKTVDFNINGVCNLNCKWCWGPVHNAREDVSTNEWKNIAYKLKEMGTENVVFTGGETLLKKDLPSLVRYVSSELGLRTTLSSNGLLLVRRGASVLPYINDLGLPLDGHTMKVNALMRRGTPLHFAKVLEAIKFAQSNFPNTELTVRTVVASPNVDSVPHIGNTLLEAGVDSKKMRWKIYQVSPIGPRREEILNGDLLVTRKQFEEIVAKTRHDNPLFNIAAQPYENSFGRYFHIFPDGKSHIVMQGKDGMPLELEMGNIVKDFDEVMRKVNQNFDFAKNSNHGKA